MLSSTGTKFAGCLRKVGKLQYNHASISLDAELTKLYAFARPQHNGVFCGKLVHETLERYTLNQDGDVPVVVLKVPCTQEQYAWVEETVHRIEADADYMYNLFSVLSYPLTKGFKTYKAFTCVEFISYLLSELGYPFEQPFYRYKPDDLLDVLGDCVVYQGDVRGCMQDMQGVEPYFAPFTRQVLWGNTKGFVKIFARSVKGICHTAKVRNV